MVKKIFIICCLLFVGGWLFAKPALGKDFSSFYKVTYTFDEQNNALVVQEISLVNNTADLYVSQYTLSLSGSNLSKIEAYDKIGIIKTETLVKDNTTLVILSFNEKAVGKGKILSFILKYQINNFAKIEGNLKQILLPRLTKTEEIDEYQLTLRVPFSYGKVSYINPHPIKEEKQQNYSTLLFDKESLTKYGVMANFGPYQSFDFKLVYELSNETKFPTVEKIAIPPDTFYQTIAYNYLNPLPIDVNIDNDGNWLASYRVEPSQKLLVETSGRVDIFSSYRVKSSEKSIDLKNYLKPQKYWPVNNQEIIDLANKLKTPEAIYNFVTQTLSYDYSAISLNNKRRGALSAIKDPKSSICTDFSDLFIAIARAAGIPARELQGYAYTENPKLKPIAQDSDLLHSWPEFYDETKKQWVQIDPTFANTASGLDFFNQSDMSHFVFATHGESDWFPLPAGAYKSENYLGKQVFVNLSKENFIANNGMEFYDIQPKKVYSLLNNNVEITLKNNSGKAIYNDNIEIIAEGDYFPKNFQYDNFLPYSTLKRKLVIKPKDIFKDYQLSISIKYGEEIVSKSIKVYSLFLRMTIVFISLSTMILTIILFSLLRDKGLFLKKKPPVLS